MTIEDLIQTIFGSAGVQGQAGSQSGAAETSPLDTIFGAAGVPGAPGAQSGAGAAATPGRYGPFLRIAPSGVPATAGVEGAQGSPSGGVAPRAPFGPFIQPAPTGDPATAGVQGQPGSPAGPAVQAPVNVADRSQYGTPYDSARAAGGQTPVAAPATTGSIPARPAPNLSLPDNKPSIMERIGGVFAGLSGPDALATYEASNDKHRALAATKFAQNATFKALIGKGLDEGMATAAVVNPEVLKSILPSVFGGGLTDDLKEYLFDVKQRTARGEKNIPNYGQWKAETSSRSSTLPSFEWINPDDHSQGQRAITGGQFDTKTDMAREQARTSAQNLTAGLDRMASTVNQLKQAPGLEKIFGLWGALKNIPGGQAADAQAQLDTLKAKVGFEVLQEMRNASKSGGALGQVTEGEHKLLQNALQPLQQAQSYEAAVKALDGIQDFVEQSKTRINGAYERTYGAGGAAPPGPSRPSTPSSASKPDPLGIR